VKLRWIFAILVTLGASIGQAQKSSEVSSAHKVMLYAAVGRMSWYEVDVERATLLKRGSLNLPANVQEGSPHPSMDSTGRILVAANQMSLSVRDGNRVSIMPASLAVFRVHDDGKLDFVRKYDVEVAPDRPLFWMGLVSLP
jgi:hypothetical protein